MKTITVPVGYRPHYLNNFLNNLKMFDLSDYIIVCSAENCPPCISLLETCGLPMIILRKPNSMGVKSHSGARDNMFNAINYAFSFLKTDFNLHLEDDFILSPDAMHLTNWYYNNYKDKPTTYMCYGLFNWGSGGEDYSGLVESPAFHGLGWSIFKENWDACYKSIWYDDTYARKHFNTYGWDWAIEGYFKEFGCKSLLPSISRSYHNGRIDGTCCTVDYFDKAYANCFWNKTEVVKDFVLRDRVETKHLH